MVAPTEKTMEAVKLFNAELSSLYETKPPISKAKMTQITRTAMKAIKFYKHVVQSVEKFIQKCKPEYKVPGLYVIDSIVRQSRHQYTPEKDVFAPRFARNMQTTFLHLFNCTPEDKSKIVRVLNLWQKNNVFTSEVIQPLLDLAAAVANRDTVSSNGVQAKTPPLNTSSQPRTPTKDPAWLTAARNSTDNNNDSKIAPVSAPKVKMDKKLFDYDYGDDDDDDAGTSPARGTQGSHAVTPQNQQQQPLPNLESLSSILSNPEVLRQLHTLQQQMAARQQQQELEDKNRRLQEMKHQEEEFDRHLAQTVPNLPFASECDFKPSYGGAGGMGGVTGVVPPIPPVSVPPPPLPTAQPTPSLTMPLITSSAPNIEMPIMVQPPPVPPPNAPPYSQPPPPQPPFSLMDKATEHTSDYDERARQMEDMRHKDMEGRDEDSNSVEVIDLVRSPSREMSEPRRRRRSRSRGRRSRSRSRRRRSRSNEREDRDWDSRKQREIEREKDRERRKKGLPPIKKSHLTVCSTTLWVGHLSKLIHEDQLSNIFGEYGEIVSINLIPPRGCAFICMNRRQDAQRALHGLRYYKIQSKAISVAWAPGKGMKEKEWKDYWEVDIGASYIPWNKISPGTNFSLLEDGGMLDHDSFPDWLKEKYYSLKRDGSQGRGEVSRADSIEKMVGELPPLPSGPQPPAMIPPPEVQGPPPPQPPPQSAPLPPPMGLLPPPPFPIQPRLLGPMGMPMAPPGLVANMPMGVPPPIMMPQQMIPRMPPPFNNQFGSMDKRDSLLGVPPPMPPPMPNMQPPPMNNPFGLPDHALQSNNVNNSMKNNSNTNLDKGNQDLMEMDVVNDQEDDLEEKDEDSPSMPRRGRSPQMDSRIEERPPLIPNAPPMRMPHFDHYGNRPGGRGRDDDDAMYPPPPLMDYPPPMGAGGGGNPFYNPRGRPIPRHMRSPNGPMFGPRGGAQSGPNMGMRPPRHPGGRGIGLDGRGGFMMAGGRGISPRGNRFGPPQGNQPDGPFGSDFDGPYGGPSDGPFGGPPNRPFGGPFGPPHGGPPSDGPFGGPPFGGPHMGPPGGPYGGPFGGPHGVPPGGPHGQFGGPHGPSATPAVGPPGSSPGGPPGSSPSAPARSSPGSNKPLLPLPVGPLSGQSTEGASDKSEPQSITAVQLGMQIPNMNQQPSQQAQRRRQDGERKSRWSSAPPAPVQEDIFSKSSPPSESGQEAQKAFENIAEEPPGIRDVVLEDKVVDNKEVNDKKIEDTDIIPSLYSPDASISDDFKPKETAVPNFSVINEIPNEPSTEPLPSTITTDITSTSCPSPKPAFDSSEDYARNPSPPPRNPSPPAVTEASPSPPRNPSPPPIDWLEPTTVPDSCTETPAPDSTSVTESLPEPEPSDNPSSSPAQDTT